MQIILLYSFNIELYLNLVRLINNGLLLFCYALIFCLLIFALGFLTSKGN